ncbi:hypothetical protein CDD81_2984 [Ophiocordyceps australis]|uniref:Uncharacterized protein n=1 Tax=Ophiocordyceps australis TaxID=1399860 RepID=A0A2C5YCH6_9HYPO|nr:hypothetical protein CDD81_2984 [Ophiocordyceps australis]
MDLVPTILRMAVELLPISAAVQLFSVASEIQNHARDTVYMLSETEGDYGGNSSGSAVPLLAGLTTLAIAFLVVVWTVRLIIFWTRLALRVALWTALLTGCALIWTRGVGPCLRDAVIVAAKALGFLMVVKDVCIEAYIRYNERESLAQTGATGNWVS